MTSSQKDTRTAAFVHRTNELSSASTPECNELVFPLLLTREVVSRQRC